jgi:hypothetical protein
MLIMTPWGMKNDKPADAAAKVPNRNTPATNWSSRQKAPEIAKADHDFRGLLFLFNLLFYFLYSIFYILYSIFYILFFVLPQHYFNGLLFAL